LYRNIIWRTPGGKRVKVSSTRMVSFTQRHLAIMTMEVTMLEDEAPVVISSQTLNRQDGRDEYHVRSAAMGTGVDPRRGVPFETRVLEPQSHWWQDQRIILGYRCANSKMTLAVGVDHQIITDNDYRTFTSADEDTGKMVYRVQAKPGQPIKVTKVVSYHTSRGVPNRTASSPSSQRSGNGWTSSGSDPMSWCTVSRRYNRRFAGTSSRSLKPPRGPSSPGCPPRV
jgi:alpha,alpha-trehalose phosphorylase